VFKHADPFVMMTEKNAQRLCQRWKPLPARVLLSEVLQKRAETNSILYG